MMGTAIGTAMGTAIDTALPEILRALRQDRTHVVLVVSHDLASQLVAQLTKELVDTMRVGIAHFAGQDESSAAECVLSALGVLGADEAPISARIELERLAQVGSNLILLIPDALSVDPRLLRDLGDLAVESENVLRIALIAERDRSQTEDPAARLVAALGTGAAKIDVAPPRCPPSDIPTGAPFGPTPAALSSSTRWTHPIAVRTARPPRRRAKERRSLVLGSLLAMLALSIWAVSPEVVLAPATSAPVSSVGPEVEALPPALVPIEIEPVPMSTSVEEAAHLEPPARLLAVVAVVSAPVPPPIPLEPQEPEELKVKENVPKIKPQKMPQQPVAPPRVATVRVNLNAWPYAEIEVDGEAVGLTPIANLPLSAGWHSVRAVFPDGRVSEERVLVDSLRTHFRIP